MFQFLLRKIIPSTSWSLGPGYQRHAEALSYQWVRDPFLISWCPWLWKTFLRAQLGICQCLSVLQPGEIRTSLLPEISTPRCSQNPSVPWPLDKGFPVFVSLVFLGFSFFSLSSLHLCPVCLCLPPFPPHPSFSDSLHLCPFLPLPLPCLPFSLLSLLFFLPILPFPKHW